MTSYQKLVRNGTSTAVTIPRRFLHALNWLSGDDVFLEVTEDRAVVIRRISREALRRSLTSEPEHAPALSVAK